MESQRKLISIVFSDIKGYTSLMHSDESKALSTVSRYEETIIQVADKFRGEIINFMGDGALIIFANSVDAIDFGIAIQKAFSSGDPIPHRVGIHTGEGIIKGNKIYGDSVNIASRIESISVPGALLISDATYQLVKNQKKYNPVLMGKYRFKNLNEPMKVYAINNDNLVVPSKKQLRKNTGAKSYILYYLVALIAIPSLIFLAYNNGLLSSKQSATFSYEYPSGQSYFVGIGIDEYDHWEPLNNAVNDVNGVAKVFKEQLGFEELLPLMKDEDATKKNLNEAFNLILPPLLKPEDRLIVFFAGHGYTEKSLVNSDSIDIGYLVPQDASDKSASNINSYINIDSLLNTIGELPPNEITVILDACASGFAISENFTNSISEATDAGKTRLVITSADKYQTASDAGPIKNHSLFTGKLIECLENGTIPLTDNFFDVRDLASYLLTAVANYSSQSPKVGPFHNHEDNQMRLYLHTISDKVNLDEKITLNENDSLETIAVIPFENLSNDAEFQNYASYLEASLFQFLSEVQTLQPNFRTITPPSIKSLTRGSSNVAYSAYSSIGADIILSGQLFKLGKETLIVKPTILDGTGKVLGVFQDIIVENYDMRKAAFLLKQRLKTFFLEKEDLTTLTVNVPDYRAFLLHEKADDNIRKDHDKVREFASQAIEIDSQYLDAHLTYLLSYLDYERNYEKAETYAAYLKNKFKDIDLTNYQRQRLNISVAEAHRNYSDIFKAYNGLLQEHPKDNTTIGNTIVYAYNSNHLEECKAIIDRYRTSEYFKKRKGAIDNIYVESLWNQDSISKAHDYIQDNSDIPPHYYEYNLGLSYALQNDIPALEKFMNKEFNEVIGANKSYGYFLPLAIGKLLLLNNQSNANKYFDLAIKEVNEKTHLKRLLTLLNFKKDYAQVIQKVKTKNIDIKENSSTNLYIGIELLKAYAGSNMDSEYSKTLQMLIDTYEKEQPHLLHYGIAHAEAIKMNESKSLEHIKIAYSKGREFRFPRYKYDPYFLLLKNNAEFIEFNADRSL